MTIDGNYNNLRVPVCLSVVSAAEEMARRGSQKQAEDDDDDDRDEEGIDGEQSTEDAVEVVVLAKERKRTFHLEVSLRHFAKGRWYPRHGNGVSNINIKVHIGTCVLR